MPEDASDLPQTIRRSPAKAQRTYRKVRERAEDDFSADLHDPALEGPPGHADESFPASEAKTLYDLLPDWDRADLDRLPVLREGTRLEQGAVYLDLRDPRRVP